MADIFDDLKRDWDQAEHAVAGWFHRNPHPATIEPTQEAHMSFITDLKAEAHALAAKVETIDEAAMADFEAVINHPEALAVFKDVAQLVHLNVTPGVISGVTGGLKTILGMFAPAQAAAPAEAVPAPAGPVVGGQA